jgi:fibronectin type 3 domain-containing protein
LNPSQAATLNVQLDPTVAGSVSGQLTVTSNSSTNGTDVIPMSATAVAATYAVNLSWEAPTGSPDPVAGYNIYRAPSGSSTYALLNSSDDTSTTFVDSTVTGGVTYDYIVDSVDSSGVESVPSNMIVVVLP